MLRHSFTTHLLENRTDIRYIELLLGHSYTKKTEIYTNVANKSLMGIIDLLTWFYNVDIDNCIFWKDIDNYLHSIVAIHCGTHLSAHELNATNQKFIELDKL